MSPALYCVQRLVTASAVLLTVHDSTEAKDLLNGLIQIQDLQAAISLDSIESQQLMEGLLRWCDLGDPAVGFYNQPLYPGIVTSYQCCQQIAQSIS